MKDSSQCNGCYNNFYNGNNSLGVSRCWSLKDATLVKKIQIHVDQPPPFKQKPITVPSCYTAQRYVFVKPENLTKDGYWK